MYLTNAFLHGLQFGRDVIFTYGPWAFVSDARGDPAIYPWLIFTRLLLASALVAGAAWVVVEYVSSGLGRWFRMGLIIALADPKAVLPVLLLVIAAWRRREGGRAGPLLVALLAVACGLIAWIKFTGFVLVAALCIALLAQDLARRRFPAVACAVAAAAAVFWPLAGQSLRNIPAYVQGGFALAASYSGNMNVNGPAWQVILGAALCLSVLSACAAFVIDTGEWSLTPAVAWMALFLAIYFKESFTRHEEYHIWMGMLDALLPASLIFVVGAGFLDRELVARLRTPASRFLVRAAPVCAVCLSLVFLLVEWETASRLHDRIWKTRSVFSRRTPALRAIGYQSDMTDLRTREPLGPIPGAADFFPDKVAILFANGIESRLRPIPQAYTANNRFLTSLNASFLRGSGRPDFVVFDVAPIDGRYPTLADPLSVEALLSCYAPEKFTGRYLLLRAAKCVDAPRTLIADAAVRLGERLPVPAGAGPVWAEIEMEYSAPGLLAGLLLRPPKMEITVDSDASRRTYKITPDLARTGFLLSPLLSNPVSFALLYGENGPDPDTEIRGLSLARSKLIDLAYRPAIHVRLYSLRTPRRSMPASPSPELIRFARGVRSHAGLDERVSPPSWSIEGGQVRVRVNSASQGEVPMAGGHHAFSFAFGLQNDCEDQAEPVSRVRFRVLWDQAGAPGAATLLDRSGEARGETAFTGAGTIPLSGQPGRLTFLTDPEAGVCRPMAWWSDFHVQP